MNDFFKRVEIRWSDLDPNFHLRHSVHYDFGAYSRICFLQEHGLTPLVMMQHQIGPIIFREECIFKKEIKFGDAISINIKLDKTTADYGRWTMCHEIWKNEIVLAAILTIDGTWIDTQKRKLVIPPAIVHDAFQKMPKTNSFEWVTK
jgi:acyl-CoA thioester hydrolase